MTSEPDHQAKPNSKSENDSSLGLILSMADTTWRMFTPPAIFVSIGIFADLKLHTSPWLTFLSVPIGLAISVLLVKKQIERGN